MIKVKATDAYQKKSVVDDKLGIMPKEGHEFEVTEERYNVLAGNNKYKTKFVEKVTKEKSKDKTNKED